MSDAEAARDALVRGLTDLGIRSGGALLVHSSLSSLGHVAGGPETVIRGLLGALGPRGTLLMPALSYQHVRADQRRFEVASTPSMTPAPSASASVVHERGSCPRPISTT